MATEKLERKLHSSKSGRDYDIDTVKIMIDQCQDRRTKLTAWEHDFIDSIEEYFDQHKYLSEKQMAVLEKIYWDQVI